MATDRCPGQDMLLWKPGDIFDVICPSCNSNVEFFKDESRRKCKKCGFDVPNPKLNMGCAQWCEFADKCLGVEAAAAAKNSADPQPIGQRRKITLIAAMRRVFGEDVKRISHALHVLSNAEEIMRGECDIGAADAEIVISAAILHDIGIQEAEKKHNSSAAKYQEIEGPPIARKILHNIDMDSAKIEIICDIIGNHHSARGRKSKEFDILWDADRIVNITDDFSHLKGDALRDFIDSTFRTETGKSIAVKKYLEETPETVKV